MIIFLSILSTIFALVLLDAKTDKQRLYSSICFALCIVAIIIYRALEIWI